MTEFYEASALNGHRYRRTNAELARIDRAILEVAEAENPVTVRGLFYRVMSLGLVPKTERGYYVVQRQTLKLRRAGVLPYGWITDGTRLRLKPLTWSSTQAALAEHRQDVSAGSVDRRGRARRNLDREGRHPRRHLPGHRGIRRAADDLARIQLGDIPA